MASVVKVLFVCTGNICRSTMAEAVFAHLVAQAGLSAHFRVDSAGTDAYHESEPAHPGTLRELAKHGITGYAHQSRRVTRADMQHFDYAIAMTDDHEYAMNSLSHNLSTHAKVARLLDYAPHLPLREVPDPYYTGEYAATYNLVLAGCQGLLATLRKEHAL
jgi:protein-tyrosine phosphatase